MVVFYAPPTNPQHPFFQNYSRGFAKLIGAKAQPILDPLVMSEYLNRYMRIEFNGGFKSTYNNFKSFRLSQDFTSIASTAKTYANQILGHCIVHPTSCHELDIKQALLDFANGGIDFNDAVFVDICKKNNFKLLTDDGDFQNGGVEILTSNPKLLKACP